MFIQDLFSETIQRNIAHGSIANCSPSDFTVTIAEWERIIAGFNVHLKKFSSIERSCARTFSYQYIFLSCSYWTSQRVALSSAKRGFALVSCRVVRKFSSYREVYVLTSPSVEWLAYSIVEYLLLEREDILTGKFIVFKSKLYECHSYTFVTL